jgi:copper chaperone CopZ
MESLVVDIPAMYGDHHVIEVRRLLLEAPGVDAVDASSAFRSVEVRFDPDQTSAEALRARLDETGYLADLDVPLESGEPTIDQGADGKPYFRHSTSYEIAGTSTGFEQKIAPPSRPLWPCPGFDMRPTEGSHEPDL